MALITDDLALQDEAARRWLGCRALPIEEPLRGVLVTPHEIEADPDTASRRGAIALADAIEADLVALSSERPGHTYLWIEASSNGERVGYYGYVVQDGHRTQPLDGTRGDGTLSRLLQPLGVELNLNEHFEPFTRGFLEI
jgi:hypothetical protein